LLSAHVCVTVSLSLSVGKTDVDLWLVTRLSSFKLRQLVLDLEFFALELVDTLLICAGMKLFFLDFLLDRLVATLEFDNMTL
jgi:hypothetical protein